MLWLTKFRHHWLYPTTFRSTSYKKRINAYKRLYINGYCSIPRIIYWDVTLKNFVAASVLWLTVFPQHSVSYLVLNFLFQPLESRRSCTPSPQLESPSPWRAPAPRARPQFAGATVGTRVHPGRAGSGAAAAKTWISAAWCPGSLLMRGKTVLTLAQPWTDTTMRREEW